MERPLNYDLRHPSRKIEAWVILKEGAALSSITIFDAWVSFKPCTPNVGYVAYPVTFED